MKSNRLVDIRKKRKGESVEGFSLPLLVVVKREFVEMLTGKFFMSITRHK